MSTHDEPLSPDGLRPHRHTPANQVHYLNPDGLRPHRHTPANRVHYLNPDAFRPHQYTPADQIHHLYHVYDNLSQTPYVPGIGINAGDPNTYWMHPQHIITYAAMEKHFDWSNREPTYFISLYSDINTARREANRRRNRIHIREPSGQVQRRDPASVRIAEVSIRELDRLKVFYFSREEMINMLQAPMNHPVFYNSQRGEWLAMEYIPDEAVTRLFV